MIDIVVRAFALVCALFIAMGLPNIAVAGPTLVVDVNRGTVLHAEDAHDLWYPASLTKLMTAYVTFNAIKAGRLKMNSPVTVSQRALNEPPSKVGFPVGTRITVSDALHLLIVKSANDISVALAETVAGSYENFVFEMNKTARALGMTRTQFVNPHGLPAVDQVTTARDMGVLTVALIRDYPQYQRLFEVPAVLVGKKRLRSHNHLLGRYQGADGMKTGFICASGFNLVASATRRNRRLAAVVLGHTSAIERKEEAEALLEKGFRKSLIGGGNRTISAFLPGPSASTNPTNMRPLVCGPNRVPRPDRTLAAAVHTVEPIRVTFLPKADATGGTTVTGIPRPVPRPDRGDRQSRAGTTGSIPSSAVRSTPRQSAPARAATSTRSSAPARSTSSSRPQTRQATTTRASATGPRSSQTSRTQQADQKQERGLFGLRRLRRTISPSDFPSSVD